MPFRVLIERHTHHHDGVVASADAVKKIGRLDLQSPTVQPPRVGNDLAGITAPSPYPPKPAAARTGLARAADRTRPLARLKWEEIAALEHMSERTLRYHLARWKAELERETQPTSELLRACEERAEHYMIAFAPRSVAHPDRVRGGRRSGRALRGCDLGRYRSNPVKPCEQCPPHCPAWPWLLDGAPRRHLCSNPGEDRAEHRSIGSPQPRHRSVQPRARTATKLSLHPPLPRPKPPPPRSWTVRQGESFGSIAAKTGINLAKLEQLNPGLKPTTLQPGDRIRLRR